MMHFQSGWSGELDNKNLVDGFFNISQTRYDIIFFDVGNCFFKT